MEEVWLSPAEIAVREFNSLRGRLCTVIESANLPKKQERALVTLIKNLSYQNQDVVKQLIESLDTEGKTFKYVDHKLQRQ
jgi:GTP-sensing pleiotropic transcriptional regulator CodY